MADIKYTPTFKHDDWIDNEDVVQASGDKGFNRKFHDLEGEFTAIAAAVGTVDTEIKKIQRLNLLIAEAPITLAAGAMSAELPVEEYDRAPLPQNVEKAYFIVIVPSQAPPMSIHHTFLYRNAGGNKMGVTVLFHNLGAASAKFAWRVMALATQP